MILKGGVVVIDPAHLRFPLFKRGADLVECLSEEQHQEHGLRDNPDFGMIPAERHVIREHVPSLNVGLSLSKGDHPVFGIHRVQLATHSSNSGALAGL